MELNAFRLVAGKAPEHVAPETILEPAEPGAEGFWLDFLRPEPEELDERLARLGVAPILRHALSEGGRVPQATAITGQALLRLPVMGPQDESTQILTLFVLERGILSVHDVEAAAIRDLASADVDTTGLQLDRPGALTLAILHTVVEVDLAVVTAFRARVEVLAAAERADPGDPELDEIVDLRERAERLTAVLEDQLYCFSAIPALSVLVEEGREFDHLCEAEQRSLQHVANVLERATRRLEQLQDNRSLHAQDSTNRRLKVLTIVQAIFTPLTLIAGIWGMNFVNMPELQGENAYFAALSLMALVATGSLAVFWRKGWFD